MTGIFGRLLKRRFAELDRDTSSWKMSRAFAHRGSTKSHPLWPPTGMIYAGIASELLILARPTDEIEFSLLPNLLPTPVASDGSGSRGFSPGSSLNISNFPFHLLGNEWDEYSPAIERWESVTGISAPEAQYIDANGDRQTSPKFIEWIMGFEPGYVTDTEGISELSKTRLLGNSVVSSAATEAYDQCLSDWI